MRVLQLIDSLEAGGAERVAVNFANGLLKFNQDSYLCTTRNEGLLKNALHENVNFLNLGRTKSVDVKALLKLKRFIKTNKISIIHAHSTSVYTAVLVKLIGAKVKIVWHDHYGKSEFLENRPKNVLQICSLFISHVFSVNDKLTDWSKNVLNINSVEYLPNFVAYSNQDKETTLKGESDFRLVCLANLRPQKDHFNLIRAFSIFREHNPKYTLHLVGKDFKDDYSNKVKGLIKELNLNNTVTIYGSCNDTFNILSQASIAVLASKSEGLPLSLLEYGLMELPVVVTNVGDCNKVVVNKENGLLVTSNNLKELAENLNSLASNTTLAKQYGEALKKTINESFSECTVLTKVINSYKDL